jgi:hypothetical protein
LGLIGNIKGPAGGAGNYIALASNFSSTSVTNVLATGLTFPVTIGKAYSVEIIGTYQTAATTTGGRLSVFLTNSGAGNIRGHMEGSIGASALATSLRATISAIGAAGLAGSFLTTTGVSAINTPHDIYGRLVFNCTATGTFNVGWATEVASSAAVLLANTTLLWNQLN